MRLWLVFLVLMAACLVKYEPWSDFNTLRRIPITGEAVRVAHNLYESGKFADPFGTLPTGYTAHLAPGFPALLSWLFRIFGDGAAGWIALSWLPVLALSLQIASFPSLSKMLGYSPWTGIIAAIFALLTKPITYEQWEAHEAGLLIFVLAALICRWTSGPRTNLLTGLTGALAGITICFQPVMAPVYLAWILLASRQLVPQGRNPAATAENWGRGALAGIAHSVGTALAAGRVILRDRRAILLWAVPILICAPWVLRNQLRLGTPWMRDNIGVELYVSFNDCVPYGFEQSQKQGCFGRFHPNQNLAEGLALRGMGEVPYNRDRMRRAFSWIVRRPGRAASLVAERTLAFWFPPNDRWPEYLRIRKRRLFFFWALTLASFGGVLRSLKRRVPGGRIIAALLALYPIVYYIVQFDHRYRYPILWATWLAAACLFEDFFALPRSRQPTATRNAALATPARA